MSKLRRLSASQRHLLLALFVCAMLVRGLIPAGWMPVGDAGGFRIVLCSGSGPMPVTMHHAMAGMHHDRAPGHDNPGADHPCAFAGVTAGIEAPMPVIPMAPAIVRTAPVPPRALVAVGRGLAAPPPPQTGPPAFA